VALHAGAAPACSRATFISTSSTATSAAASRRLTPRRCPLFCCQANNDYSCTPEETLDVAKRVPGCEAVIMKGLGHFPMSENPEEFLNIWLPVLAKIGGR